MDEQVKLQNKIKNTVLSIQKIVLWICILLWMGVIFLFSSQNGDESSKLSQGFLRTCILWVLPEHVSQNTVDVLEYIVRKAAHMTEYAILGILVSLQMRVYDIPKGERKKIGLAVLLVFLYASTDEFHQLFVGGRSGQITDVFIDSVGGFIGTMLVALIHKVREKKTDFNDRRNKEERKMVSKKMEVFLQNNSAIRAMFEEGKRMASIYGAENVYDFSLGNPNVPAPQAVNTAIKDILDNEDSLAVHGYMSNVGYEDVRGTIAESLNQRFGTKFSGANIIMTVGAAGGLNVIFKTLLNPGDEVIAFSPYFVEYNAYVTNYDGVLVEVACKAPEFIPDAEKLAAAITEKTRAVIINNPNNPTGVVYPISAIEEIADVLEKKQKEFGTDIYLISDEPYRELVYGDAKVAYLPNYYRNTIVGYSFSKSLSLPGERIGYLVIPSEISDFQNIYDAAAIATRILGFVNAPSLMQRAVAKAIHEQTDVAYYDRNRKTLYEMLTSLGFECVKPEGAFYLWMKIPTENESAFCEAAKEFHLILVPGSSFKCSGYVRVAYCVAYETILRSEEAWRKLAEKVNREESAL